MAPVESAGASVLGLREVIARQVTMNAKLLGLIICMALLALPARGRNAAGIERRLNGP